MQESLNAYELLSELEPIHLPPSVDSKYAVTPCNVGALSKSKSSQKKEFCVQCEKFLRVILSYFHEIPKWGQLFHQRMIQLQTVTLPHQIQTWCEALEYYVHRNTKKKNSKNLVLVELAQSLVTYFKGHLHDPDNAMIGLTPNERVFETFYERTADGRHYRLPENIAPERKSILDIQSERVFKTLKSSLMKKKADKPTESVDDYLVGEIVIYFKQPFWNPSCGIFARIAEPPTDKNVVLYCNPTGEETRVVNKSEILPIHPQLLNLFQDSRSAQNLVYDPINDLFQSITDHVKEQTTNFLKENQFDIELLESLIDKNGEEGCAQLTDLPKLQRMRKKFTGWQSSPPDEFYRFIEQTSQQKLKQFQSNLPSSIYQPTKVKALADLTTFQFSQLAQARLHRFAGNCDSVMGYLEIEKSNYINGKRKSQLTEWWLSTIDMATQLYLSEKQYDPSAIPDDYITNKPTDMEVIKNNLKIIEVILKKNPENDVFGLIERLTREIYQRINNFILHVKIVLSDILLISWDEFDWEKCKEKFENFPFEPQTQSSIDNLIKDVDYLLEMQEMEKTAISSQNQPSQGLVLSNVVPVSGLILSTFYRKENVLRTIIELYDHSPPPPPPTQAIPISSLNPASNESSPKEVSLPSTVISPTSLISVITSKMDEVKLESPEEIVKQETKEELDDIPKPMIIEEAPAVIGIKKQGMKKRAVSQLSPYEMLSPIREVEIVVTETQEILSDSNQPLFTMEVQETSVLPVKFTHNSPRKLSLPPGNSNPFIQDVPTRSPVRWRISQDLLGKYNVPQSRGRPLTFSSHRLK